MSDALIECDVPSASALQPHLVAAAYFRDSYRAPLMSPPPGVVEIFFAVFGHHPKWIKLLLIVRNRIAGWLGLSVPSDAEIMLASRKDTYQVGDTIGPWPIFSLDDNEIIAGRDNSHLDFRVSILREITESGASFVVSTVCIVHNGFGRLYLFFIVPFHRWGVKLIITRALAAGRL